MTGVGADAGREKAWRRRYHGIARSPLYDAGWTDALAALRAEPDSVDDGLADWLGAMPEARNVFDITDEATTVITIDVETLARRIAHRRALADSVDDDTAGLRALDEVERRLRELRSLNAPAHYTALSMAITTVTSVRRATLAAADPAGDEHTPPGRSGTADPEART